MFHNSVKFINKDVLTLFLALFLSTVFLFSRESSQVHQLKLHFSRLINTITYPITWYNDALVIREENKLLKRQIVQYNLMNSELESYHHENRRLKEMLNFIVDQPVNFVTANVVNYSFGLSTNSITIDIGEKEGILENLSIIDENGLLGKTIQVGEHAALAQLVTDKNFRVSIRIGEDRALGLFIPTHGKYGVLEGVRKSLSLSEGEIAYTSGISEIYPPNIPVAKVVSIKKDENNPFQHIIVELLATVGDLDYIFIIL